MRLGHAALMSAGRWCEWYTHAPMAQHPTMWRLLGYIYGRGSASLGFPSETTWTWGWGVLDWQESTQTYEMTRFSYNFYYWYYNIGHPQSCFAWVSDTEVIGVGGSNDSPITSVRYYCLASVALDGNVTFLEAFSTAKGYDSVANATMYTGKAVGYGGSLIYPYTDGTSYPNYPSSNHYLGKVSAASNATNLGPLRSGYTPTACTPMGLAAMGPTAVGNGFAVGSQVVANDTQFYVGLFNLSTPTPTLVSQCYISGGPNDRTPVRLGARKVVFDVTKDEGISHLVYTDHDTSPTSIAVGGSASWPNHPTVTLTMGAKRGLSNGFGCQNAFFGEGKAASFGAWSVADSDLPSGETYRDYYAPVIYTANGTSLSLTVATVDVHGNSLPLSEIYNSTTQYISNYEVQVAGAPGNRAVFFWRFSGSGNTNQRTIQL